MYYLGIDLGSSSIKLALVHAETGERVGLVQQPKEEMPMLALEKGWAEQDPEVWWDHVCNGIAELKETHSIAASAIIGVGIAYQMHGLVTVDKEGVPLRPAIIWCDSRAVPIGDAAYTSIGAEACNERLLNSPANFTASKLKWVKDHEPYLFSKIHKIMLPGDYIAQRFSGKPQTTVSGLSEGILWDFKENAVASILMEEYGFEPSILPEIVDTFSIQCRVSAEGAAQSGLNAGTPILYRAGDQPNNALSLNVFEPGEVASTGGTSGVVYAITDTRSVKECARVNNFAHVNHDPKGEIRIGKLLCVNGAGIQYRWLLNNLEVGSYGEMNALAGKVPIGSDGLTILPFGNGAERMLLNRDIGTRMLNVDLNRHDKAHLCRAALEGIAFSFVYGMEIMKTDGLNATVIRAGNDNLYRSELFSKTVATLMQMDIEIYDTTGAVGAARACIISGSGHSAFSEYMKKDYIMTYTPDKDVVAYQEAYKQWKKELDLILNQK